MHSLKELYKIGRGPSSSHTIGPERVCKIFKNAYPNASEFKVILYGSLSFTGKGHCTDEICKKTLYPTPCTVIFDDVTEKKHPNTIEIYAYLNGEEIGFTRAYSIGGGTIEIEGVNTEKPRELYEFNSFTKIANYCKEHNLRLYEYVEKVEGKEIRNFISEIWKQMKSTIKSGLSKQGVLPGGLNVERKAYQLFNSNHIDETSETRENRLVCAYAFASCEENASGETMVTAPTCGSCGIVPAVLYYYQQKRNFTDDEIINALETAGLIGILIKTNASISGAECGCQAEVGSACSMASAGLAELLSMSIDQIEYSAEIAMEHHLGLTCDPICGLVQIPCIERNAVAAMRAINAVNLANFLTNSRKISFDLIVDTMYETGKDLHSRYRETSVGGMAKLYKNK
ncbi:MAG: L-serine ammonia-lyase [Clostridia bacterium]|nr:L-serine ammonia-lyase [Clostridia bacterium]